MSDEEETVQINVEQIFEHKSEVKKIMLPATLQVTRLLYRPTHVRLATEQCVEVLRSQPEGHGFDSRSGDWDFSSTLSYGPGFDPASNKNEC
jgi:hypothetical protein